MKRKPQRWFSKKEGDKVKHIPIFSRHKRNYRMPSKQQVREALAQELAEEPVRNVSYTPESISLTFNGELISNEIQIKPHESWVGSWSRKKQVIYIDDDLPEEWRETIAVHETIEKYLRERYGLNENAEGHETAEEIEKRNFLKTYSQKEWEKYNRVVERIHRKESAYLPKVFSDKSKRRAKI